MSFFKKIGRPEAAVLLIAVAAGLSIIWHKKKETVRADGMEEFAWKAPDTLQLSFSGKDALIRYGKNLVAQTSVYLGPKGRVAAVTNGMNCQNCHLDAGTKQWGNNYSAVWSTYPKFRERSGTIENVYKRVNDCLQRSLNGRMLDTNSMEIQAMVAYINWVGKDVPGRIVPRGAGIKVPVFMQRAADPRNGAIVYALHCRRCHGPKGEGVFNPDSSGYVYPPLWGEHSYTTAAGLYRISRLAGYVRQNMPFDAAAAIRHLTDEEAWDVAAFINTQPRPAKVFKEDWPDMADKPIDLPFGPYADSFSEAQHKYGPFGPIQLARQKK